MKKKIYLNILTTLPNTKSTLAFINQKIAKKDFEQNNQTLPKIYMKNTL